MDYEKKYNEALNRAKPKYKMAKEQNANGTMAWIEEIFPELRESEDERIRKWLIRTLKGLCNSPVEIDGSYEMILPAIAWLEKQKVNTDGDFARGYDCGYECCLNSHGAEWFEKQKEPSDPEERMNHPLYLEGFDVGRKVGQVEAGQNPEKWEDWKDKINIPYCSSDEQKPAEPQDYSNLTDFERAIHRGFLCAGVENVPVTIIKETAQDCLAQIPDEIAYGEYLGYGERQYARGFKDGSETKPAEWSEEDENMVWNTISIVGQSKSLRQDAMIEWLKSLRPQKKWKPSEEQMKALQNAVALTACDKELARLYNQLKAL